MRLRNTLMIGQITICAFLLVCSGVCIRGARAMEAFDPGVKTRGAMFAQLSEKNRPQALRRLAAERAVESIAAVSSVPLDGLAPSLTISVAGRGITLRAWHNHVSHEFFHVLDVRLLAGRTFTAAEEKESAPVVILSELAARTLWPKGSAVGREIEIRREPEDNWGEALPKYSKVRVVGVARNIITCSVPYGPDPSLVYFPTAVDGHTALVARVNGDVETVRRKVASDLDATFPGALQQIHPMDQAFAGNVYPFRVASWVGLALGGLALLLTLSGIYGVLSYLITQRTKEIGIRMALGATSGAVARLVLRQSGRLALIGICIGAAMALGVSRLMASHLVFINTFDALAYGGGIVLVAVSALAAAYIPSRRAARIDPGTTLRYD